MWRSLSSQEIQIALQNKEIERAVRTDVLNVLESLQGG